MRLQYLPFCSLFFFMLAGCEPGQLSLPEPTGATLVHSQGEDANMGRRRQEWLQLMHGGPASDWEKHEQENRQMIVLAVATVGNDNAHIRGVLEQISQALRVHPVAEFVDQQMDVYAF